MRDWMERQQSWIYLIFILAGLAVGLSQPDTTSWLEAILWPLLGGLLYATFTQVPLTRIGQGLKDWRFLAALLLGNFVVIPLVLGGMMTFIPLPPVVQAGVLLVLLVPCTDWCISFTHLGKGDAGRAIAATPVLLLVQLLALPVYLWLFLGVEWFQTVLSSHLLGAFAGLIITPLALAWVTERLAERHLNASAVGNFVEQSIGAAVEVTRRDDVVTRREKMKDGVFRREAPRQGQPEPSALQRRQIVLAQVEPVRPELRASQNNLLESLSLVLSDPRDQEVQR